MPRDVFRFDVRRMVQEGAQLVEVLPRQEYEDEHLPGAINIPLKELDRELAQLTAQLFTPHQLLLLPVPSASPWQGERRARKPCRREGRRPATVLRRPEPRVTGAGLFIEDAVGSAAPRRSSFGGAATTRPAQRPQSRHPGQAFHPRAAAWRATRSARAPVWPCHQGRSGSPPPDHR